MKWSMLTCAVAVLAVVTVLLSTFLISPPERPRVSDDRVKGSGPPVLADDRESLTLNPWCIATRYRAQDAWSGWGAPSQWTQSWHATNPIFDLALPADRIQRQVFPYTGEQDWAVTPVHFVNLTRFIDTLNPCSQPWIPAAPPVPPEPVLEAPSFVDARGFSWLLQGRWCQDTRFRYRYLNRGQTGAWSGWSGVWSANGTFAMPRFQLLPSDYASSGDYQPSFFTAGTLNERRFQIRSFTREGFFFDSVVALGQINRFGVWNVDQAAPALTEAFRTTDPWRTEHQVQFQFDVERNRFVIFITGRDVTRAVISSTANASLAATMGFVNQQEFSPGVWTEAISEATYDRVYAARFPISVYEDQPLVCATF
jgi:hypothetical protein